MKILILGGYGIFGGRLAHLLSDEPGLTLIIAGRSEEKARVFCKKLPGAAKREALRFDRDKEIEQQLRAIQPALVVDATGPFQSYGEDPYRVVKACIAAGMNYLDLADGSDFVKGISQFDAQAKAKNIYILSGVSSFPVLTAAVIRHLSPGFARITKVVGGIAPSPYAGVGPNVIRAIAGYAGKRIALIREGRTGHGYALTETMRYTISPPGHLPLKNIRFSLVDVPDLQLLPDMLPQLDSIWIGAGPVPEILHRMLNGLAWLVRMRLLPSVLPLAPLFHFVINHVRWGEHRGGMFVSVEGSDAEGKKKERSWHLLAEGDDGPFIPSMAIEAIVRRVLNGKPPASGARPALNDLELEDYLALFNNRKIHTGDREAAAEENEKPLSQRVLGNAWAALPEPVRGMHDRKGELIAEGMASVERGTGLLSRAIARLFRFPEQGKEVPVRVVFRDAPEGELWHRTFNGKSFSSTQFEGKGRFERLIVERFGPFKFGLALVFEDERLKLVIRRWSFLGLPLPLALTPGGETYEFVENGRFCFNVEIRFAMTGLIVRYRGWLVPVA